MQTGSKTKKSADGGNGKSKRTITKSRILSKLPREAFSFPRPDKKDKSKGSKREYALEEAMGIDLSGLGAEGLDADALEAFKNLRRLSLKQNNLTSIPSLPSTLTYLDVSNNPGLKDLSGLAGLSSLTTLIMSDCSALCEAFQNDSLAFKDCKSLKVLVMDHCGLVGELNLKKASFARSLETLIVSHNEIEIINLKGVSLLRKLSASNNPKLKAIKHMASSCELVAEIRLAHCPKLVNLEFLSKRQRKLALLDLSACPLVQDWSMLTEILNVESLLTLSLKGTPIRADYKSKEDYEKACFANLKCKKLRTLDFANVTKKSDDAKKSDSDSDSEGEDFSALIKKDESDDEDESDSDKKQDEEEPETVVESNVEDAVPFEASVKRAKIKDDEDLFQGKNSAW